MTFPIRPGYVGLIPPAAQVSYRFTGRSTHLYAHFALRPDAGESVEIPAMQDAGDRFFALSDRFYEAVQYFPSHPTRAEARLLDILWELALPSPGSGDAKLAAAPSVVREASHLIKQLIAVPLSVPYIAEHVEVTADHLTRLFRQHLGTTVVEYIRQQRAARARHLLLHSWLPIKTIAQQVGIPNIHLFSKTIRRELGASPREVRRQGAVKT